MLLFYKNIFFLYKFNKNIEVRLVYIILNQVTLNLLLLIIYYQIFKRIYY